VYRAPGRDGALMARKPPLLHASPHYGWAKGSDRRWRKLRARKLADEPRCERCLEKGLVTMATEVHHVLPINEGGAKYDYANLQSVCGDCQDEAHGAKPKIRIDPRTGLPLRGQDHPWSDPE
jgi:5-methylcytosine-specific restriction enzyme A